MYLRTIDTWVAYMGGGWSLKRVYYEKEYKVFPYTVAHIILGIMFPKETKRFSAKTIW